MTNVAVLAGLDPRVVADYDEDEFQALTNAIRDRAEIASWTNLHEILCSVVESIWQLSAQIDAGLKVVNIKGTTKPADPGRYKRPKWVEPDGGKDDGVIVVRSPAEAMRMMKAGADSGN